MANHFEKQQQGFYFAFVQNEVTAWRQSWTRKSEILTSRKKLLTELDFSCVHTCLFLIWWIWDYFCLKKLLTYQLLKVGGCTRRKNKQEMTCFLYLSENILQQMLLGYKVQKETCLQYVVLLYFYGTASCCDGNSSSLLIAITQIQVVADH